MSRANKNFEKLMSGKSDASFPFADLCSLLQCAGYAMRPTKGSHVIFQKGSSFLNIQNQGAKAKAYQVRQVREELGKLPADELKNLKLVK